MIVPLCFRLDVSASLSVWYAAFIASTRRTGMHAHMLPSIIAVPSVIAVDLPNQGVYRYLTHNIDSKFLASPSRISTKLGARSLINTATVLVLLIILSSTLCVGSAAVCWIPATQMITG